MTKQLGEKSLIDLYVNTAGTKADTKRLIDPFYQKLCEILSSQPPLELFYEHIHQEAIEATANDDRDENNISVEANSVADEIKKLSKLKADGALTEEEYTNMKNELIDKM